MASPPQPLLFLVGQPVCFRRMSPQEDLVATLSGIDVLLRQRQELIDRLVGRHKELSRRHEIGALVDFSKQIDAIMKLRGFTVVTPNMANRLNSLSTHKDVQCLDFPEFHPRDLNPKSGMRSLQHVLRSNKKMVQQ